MDKQVVDSSLKVRRVRGEERRDALLRCAGALLADEGFHDVSLNEIIRRAGGSKATVVKYFGNRAGLLAAALAEGARQSMVGVVAAAASQGDAEDLPAALNRLLTGLLRFYLRPEVLRSYRDVSAASRLSTELATAFYKSGHEVVVDEITAFLQNWSGRGVRTDIDLRGDVSRLTHMLRSDLYERALYGILPAPPDDAEITAMAEATARLFLRGVAPPD